MTRNDAIDTESIATTAEIVRVTTALIAPAIIIGAIRPGRAIVRVTETVSRDTAMKMVTDTNGRVTRPTGEMIATTNVGTNPPVRTMIPRPLKR